MQNFKFPVLASTKKEGKKKGPRGPLELRIAGSMKKI
jgi:hypothetical protein